MYENTKGRDISFGISEKSCAESALFFRGRWRNYKRKNIKTIICEKIVEKFSISKEDAEKYMSKYSCAESALFFRGRWRNYKRKNIKTIICEKIVEKFSISKEDAEKYMSKY